MLAAVVVAAALGTAAGWPVWRHDLERRRFDREVSRLAWPSATEVGRRTEFGLLWCCSNHCDLRTRVLLDREPTQAELDAMALPSALGGPASARLVPVDDDLTGITDREEREAWRQQLAPSASLVEIVAQSYGELDLLDPRCH
ncbi:MAG: hypothetical protein H6735_28095 [Alphaproteobacteria bacterium]|nr:hypothetical protein [Alphaproteobacteria bacterium]